MALFVPLGMLVFSTEQSITESFLELRGTTEPTEGKFESISSDSRYSLYPRAMGEEWIQHLFVYAVCFLCIFKCLVFAVLPNLSRLVSLLNYFFFLKPVAALHNNH